MGEPRSTYQRMQELPFQLPCHQTHLPPRIGGTTRPTRACDGREWGSYVGNLWHQGRDLGDLARMWSRHGMRDHLPFGRDLPRLGRRLDRGHGQNPTMSCGHQIYYRYVNSGNMKGIKGKAHPRPQHLDRSFCHADNSHRPDQEDHSTHGGVPDTSGMSGCTPSTGPELEGSVPWPTRTRKRNKN